MSTIGFERRWNSMLSLDRQAFVEALADVPPKPEDMARIQAFNRGHGEMQVRV
jgi:hydroxyacylglutathione hydrolase